MSIVLTLPDIRNKGVYKWNVDQEKFFLKNSHYDVLPTACSLVFTETLGEIFHFTCGKLNGLTTK